MTEWLVFMLSFGAVLVLGLMVLWLYRDVTALERWQQAHDHLHKGDEYAAILQAKVAQLRARKDAARGE